MDAESKEETVDAVDSGLTSSTIPGRCERKAQNGVSVDNVPEQMAGYNWYVYIKGHKQPGISNAIHL